MRKSAPRSYKTIVQENSSKETVDEKERNKFLHLPLTWPGWLAVGLTALFVILFLVTTNNLFHIPGMLVMGIGVLGGIAAIVAILWKLERSWLIWLVWLPGVFAILFSLGEVIAPH
jgi:hypothetical protein